MDFNELGTNLGQLIGGFIALIIGIGWFKKQMSQDKLDVTKSNTERELIELLRDQVKVSSSDFDDLKEKYKELEKNIKITGRERDEALKELDISKDDVTRLENKNVILEGIIVRLNDALKIASDNLNSDGTETTSDGD